MATVIITSNISSTDSGAQEPLKFDEVRHTRSDGVRRTGLSPVPEICMTAQTDEAPDYHILSAVPNDSASPHCLPYNVLFLFESLALLKP